MRSLVAALLLLVAVPAAADARFFGSTLRAPNVSFGCEAAPILDPITGVPELVATGRRTCTYRHLGYLNRNRITTLVPAKGRIVRIRVRSGSNPAPLRLTIMTASTSTTNGFTCCTARRYGRVFRPRANKITTVRTNMPVRRDNPNGTSQFTDAVAISAVGPGTLPLRDEGTAGTYADGGALAGYYYPMAALGDPRAENNGVDGLDVLFQWDFRRNR